MKAINLATNAELHFDAQTTPEYAVAYAYHVEQENNASRFFHSVQTNDQWWQEKTPFVRGSISICAGDWAARTDGK